MGGDVFVVYTAPLFTYYSLALHLGYFLPHQARNLMLKFVEAMVEVGQNCALRGPKGVVDMRREFPCCTNQVVLNMGDNFPPGSLDRGVDLSGDGPRNGKLDRVP